MIKRGNGLKTFGYTVFLMIALLVFLIPATASAEGIQVSQTLSLEGWHYWKLQQSLTSVVDTVSGDPIDVSPVSAPKSGSRSTDLKNGSVVSDTIEREVGKPMQLTFDAVVSNEIIVNGQISVTAVQDVNIDKMDVYLEVKDSSGNWVRFLDREGNPVKIPVVTEQTPVTGTKTFSIYTILSMPPHEMEGKNPRWVSEVMIEGNANPSKGYQDIMEDGILWRSACTSTFKVVGLTADSGLVMSNATVDGVNYPIPSGLGTYSFSRELGDLSNATITVDVSSANIGTYYLTSLNLVEFSDVLYPSVRDLTSKVIVPIKIVYPITGLTPGYWKNWRNHYTSEQFNQLLAGTFVGQDIDVADDVFEDYSAKQPVTILRAHLLATQLTLNLVDNPLMPNTDKAYLKLGYQFQFNGESNTIGDVINQALAIDADPSSYSKDQILEIKDLLDYINNLE